MSTGIPGAPGSREPGLDQLISALTADGYSHELAGRDAALAAFRAARSQPRRRVRTSMGPSGSARLGAVAATVVAALAGLTVAAYAQALPAPMQGFAHSVFAPFGVPADTLASISRSHPAASAHHLVTGRHDVARRSAGAGCPCHARTRREGIKGATLTITAARTQFPANGWDAFAGTLTHSGRPEHGVRLMLLEQKAGASGWQQAGSGVTGPRGGIRVGIAHLTQNATFELAGPGGVASPSISVTVIPHVSLGRARAKAGTNRLVAASRFGDPGDVVVLEKLSGGSWQKVASEPLNAAHRAPFDLPVATSAGQYYRAVLQATGTHGASVSQQLLEPRSHTTGTVVPSPIVIRTSPPSHHTHHHKVKPAGTGSPTPDPGSSSPTSSPSPTGSPSPSPSPVTQSPVTPSPTPDSSASLDGDLV